jgi:DNA-binding GntR family transcriptional regulator
MRESTLPEKLTGQIVEYIHAEGLQLGDRLPERKLARHLRVSRSPIRAALGLLKEKSVVRHESGRGFLIASLPTDRQLVALKNATRDPLEDIYLKIAEDHLAGNLSDRMSENALMRRYALQRGQLGRILDRAAEEGWAERRPGHGWTFLPVLKSAQDYEEAYRFRILIEPAGILEPTFRLDRPALEQCRAQQQALVDNGHFIPAFDLFTMGSHFHEVLIQCSGNFFLIDALLRLNRLRRLIEYRGLSDRTDWLSRCREHIQLADMLLDGDRPAAADFLRKHLQGGAAAKKFVF